MFTSAILSCCIRIHGLYHTWVTECQSQSFLMSCATVMFHLFRGASMSIRSFAAIVIFSLATHAFAQAARDGARERPAPTVADYEYGHDSERQKLDFWRAESDAPTPVVLMIHGGGWVRGDKGNYGGG